MKRFVMLSLLLASPALAQEKAQENAPQPQYRIECRGQFGPNATHAGLVKAYGAKNVIFDNLLRLDEIVEATILFPHDETRRVEIEWHDEKKRRRPRAIIVFGEKNRWIGPLGIRNTMTIEEIEKRAGKPFRINGFGTDESGAGHFAGTRLEKLPGGCAFEAKFDIEGGHPGDGDKDFIGEVEIDSNNPRLLKLKPKIYIFTLRYDPPA